MSIANTTIINAAGTSDIEKIFTAFCAEVFSWQEIIIKNKESSTQNSELDFKTYHKSLEIFIKTLLDNEKFSLLSMSIKDVVYAMAAIADEVFLNIEWEGKQFWEENILEMKFFGTQFAGEEIFNKFNELLDKNDSLLIEKAMVYLKMLSLGFKGKYRGVENEQTAINTYRRRLFEFIAKYDKSIFLAEYRLFQKEYTYTIPSVHRKLLPDSSIITYISAFFIFIFLTVSSFVWIFETKDLRGLLFEISCIALRK